MVSNRNDRAEDRELLSFPTLPVLVLIVLAGVLTAFMLWDGNKIEDDAFVFFRYADNFLAGHGLTWNPGDDLVEGYTSVIYTLLLIVLRSPGSDPVAVVHALNGLLFVATILASARFSHLMCGATPSRMFLVAPLLVATSSPMAMWARNGMETMLFALLVVACLIAAQTKSELRSWLIGVGMLFGFTVLTRPEGILLCLAVVALRLHTSFRESNPNPLRREVWTIGGLVGVVGPHLLWRLSYYGEWLPMTFYAKVDLRPDLVVRGVGGLLDYLATYSGVVTMLALLLWALSPRRREMLLLVALIFGWIAYFVLIGMNYWSTYYYGMPIQLFSLLLLGWALADHWHRVSSALWLRTLGIAVLGVLVSGNLSEAFTYNQEQARGARISLTDPLGTTRVSVYVMIGHLLRHLADPDNTLAVGPCGAIPYYSGLVTYDTLGLNDRHIARTRSDSERGPFGHDKGDGAYILSLRPTYLIALPELTSEPTTRATWYDKSFREIYALPEFHSRYEHQTVRISGGAFDGTYFNYWRRIENREAEPTLDATDAPQSSLHPPLKSPSRVAG